MPEPEQEKRASNRRLVVWLLAVVVFMGGFGYFALVPLYSLVCSLTGLNGKTERISAGAAERLQVDRKRLVTVHFETEVYGGLPWEFRPAASEMVVHPGAVEQMSYFVHNLSDEVVTGRAVDSVVPNRAAVYLRKLQCFCFTNHTLQPHQSEQMEVRYIVMPTLPENVHSLFLWYTFSQVSAVPAARSAVPAR